VIPLQRSQKHVVILHFLAVHRQLPDKGVHHFAVSLLSNALEDIRQSRQNS
jgi:hypothetical protein